MNIVELELDETLADFEIQDWIDNVFSVQYPEIKAKIKHGCSGLCNKDGWHYPSKGEYPIERCTMAIYYKIGSIESMMILDADKDDILSHKDIIAWMKIDKPRGK